MAGNYRLKTPTVVSLALLAAATLAISLAVVRVTSFLSFSEPFFFLTSGGEEDPLYSIWRILNSEPIYVDYFYAPHTLSYFNYLFYFGYAKICGAVLDLLNLSQLWLPTISKLITLAFGLCNATVFYLMLKQTGPSLLQSNYQKLLYSFAICLGPLYGFWLITARPDVPAVFFEFLGLMIFLHYDQKRNIKWLLLAVIALYVAWAFKQSSVIVVSAISLWLINQRRFIDLLLVTLLTFSLYFVTFLIGGEEYLFHSIKSQANLDFVISLGTRNFFLACAKSPLFALSLLVTSIVILRSTKQQGIRSIGLIEIALLSGIFFAFLTSMKEGASDNYYLIPAQLGALCMARESAYFQKGKYGIFTTGLAAFSIVCLIVLLGLRGIKSPPSAYAAKVEVLKATIKETDGPVFVIPDRSLNSPLILPSKPNFMLAYTYQRDSDRGTIFEAGGAKGRITNKYFNLLVLSEDIDSFDGAEIDKYYVTSHRDQFFRYMIPRPPPSE